MNIGMKLTMGSDSCTPNRLAPHPFWKTATITP